MNLPNKISISRIALIPVFLVVYMLDSIIPYAWLIGAVIFALIMATDAIDGTIARRTNQVTTLGKFLDSIADKSLVTAGLFMVVYSNMVSDIGLGIWVILGATIITIREFIISFVRQIAASRNLIIHADKFGKIKAVFQDISIPMLLAAKDLKRLFNLDGDIIEYISFGIFVAAVVLTLMSAVNYFIKNGYIFKELSKESQKDSAVKEKNIEDISNENENIEE